MAYLIHSELVSLSSAWRMSRQRAERVHCVYDGERSGHVVQISVSRAHVVSNWSVPSPGFRPADHCSVFASAAPFLSARLFLNQPHCGLLCDAALDHDSRAA